MKRFLTIAVALLLVIVIKAQQTGMPQSYTSEKQMTGLRDSILSVITGAPSQRAGSAVQPVRMITQFGAKGDGKQDCKKAFDKAMRKAKA